MQEPQEATLLPCWQRKNANELGLDGSLIDEAVATHLRDETPTRRLRNMSEYIAEMNVGQLHASLLGPVKEASGPSGLIVYCGYLVARWGDPSSVEMTFSATKSFLSAIAGLAFDRGLIPNIHAAVSDTVALEAFSSERHSRITWHHLLTQTSEWGGTLWGKPYWADTQGGQPPNQTLGEPGTVWAYNDVRINLLALALAHLWRQPLSKVLKDEVMDPIGASSSWQWPGYENCFVEVEGLRFPTVGGGAHWGDGLWASSSDLARFGLLMLAKGRWGATQILCERWSEMATTPSRVNPDYGYLWWINARCRVFPDAPSNGYCARGNGGRHLIWIDPARDLVIVSRWGENVERLLGLVSRATPSLRETQIPRVFPEKTTG